MQPQVVEELLGGGKQRGAPYGFAVAHNFNPATIFELVNDLAVDGDATNVFHIATRARLAPSDDGQGFECGTGVTMRFFGVQAL